MLRDEEEGCILETYDPNTEILSLKDNGVICNFLWSASPLVEF